MAAWPELQTSDGAHVHAHPRAAQRRAAAREQAERPRVQREARLLPRHAAQPGERGALRRRLAQRLRVRQPGPIVAPTCYGENAPNRRTPT